MTISAKDRQLLNVLNENARAQTAAIARKLGLSHEQRFRPTVDLQHHTFIVE